MNTPSEQPRKKRKYTKKSKMLLRSNYDYIDHDYWPTVYAGSKAKWERIEAKYGVKAKSLTPHEFTEAERKHLVEQGIGKQHSIPVTKDEPLYRIPFTDETVENSQ